VDRLVDDLRRGRHYDALEWHGEVVSFTRRWTERGEVFPTEPRGDAVDVSRDLFEKYAGRVLPGHESVAADSAVSMEE
jgi:Alpha-N-acetylglucosaminidase (NAGLU) C-terminal domain